MYYVQTIDEIRKKIAENYPDARANPQGLDKDDYPGYILWMVDQVEKMPDADAFWRILSTLSRQDADALFLAVNSAIKAGSWMGWINKTVESEFGFWSNDTTRDLIRKDKELYNHLPRSS
ncbi:MAG TPA: hypothetical protein VEC17_02970 [Candidatus Binatia bacterium]|nr:hypothetical protein [Candidatus Binatia bacterium]